MPRESEIPTEPSPDVVAAPAREYRYPAADLIAAAEAAFGVRPEVVHAALFLAQLTEATRDETRAAIDRFLVHTGG